MPLRCSQCHNGGQAKKANSWKSARNICFWGPLQNGGANVVFPSTLPQQPLTASVTTPTTQDTVTVQHTSTIVDTTTHASVTAVNIQFPSTTLCSFRGLTKETCQMNCNWDGSCEEMVRTTECDCNQIERRSIRKTKFQVLTYD